MLRATPILVLKAEASPQPLSRSGEAGGRSLEGVDGAVQRPAIVTGLR